jgi:membrane-associated protease RseP (regulator of RpoE activity)
MKYFSGPYRDLGFAVLLGVGIALAPSGAPAQTSHIAQIVEDSGPLLLHSSSQGYLGVLVNDIDSDAASKLKLKDTHGAVVTLIDHDAPAAQSGIRVNDVLLELNGQAIESAEQFGRMLREIPAGRDISLLISRDGNTQTINVKLADRKKMEHDVWNKIGDGSDLFAPPPKGMGLLAGSGGDTPSSSGGGFHFPFFGSSLNVGALVEPLTSQMADYLGVASGLMVKQVARRSEAAAAGLKAFDVILKVGSDNVSTISDWERALRANEGKPVQVTILRERKQQTLTLQVDSKHHRGALEVPFPEVNCPMVAEIDPELTQQFDLDAEAAAEAIRQQADKLSEGLSNLPVMSLEQAEQLRQQADKLRQSLENQKLQLDQQQLDQMRKQMDEFRKNFRPEDFKLSPQQMNDLRKQMDQLKQQIEEQMQAQGLGTHV